MKFRYVAFALAVASLASPLTAVTAKEPTLAEAKAALQQAVQFYRTQVGHQGAYVYRYSEDLSQQEGEGKALPDTAWTQPPGIATVAGAYLDAWSLTGEPYLLEAALESGHALVAGQLRSGGWGHQFELAPENRSRYAYRTEPDQGKRRNYTTLDDNKTQSCLTFLMRLDEALQFKNDIIHEAAEYALTALTAAQYPNGAWPQQFEAPPIAAEHPIKKASYPKTWSRTFAKQDYRGHYTFNDNTISDTMATMLEAYRIYQKPQYLTAAKRAGGFMLLAQMPEPQPGWAQQYDRNMHPAWARKFEPPSISGGESQGVMRALLSLARATGEKTYLEPIPRALAYYKRSLRSDGKLARFYELHTNKPLYFTKDYQLTYSDADMPTHYGFIVGARLDRIEQEYKKLAAADAGKPNPLAREVRKYKMSSTLAKRAAAAIRSLDNRGAWVEPGSMKTWGADNPTNRVIESRTFAVNVATLSQYISAAE